MIWKYVVTRTKHASLNLYQSPIFHQTTARRESLMSFNPQITLRYMYGSNHSINLSHKMHEWVNAIRTVKNVPYVNSEEKVFTTRVIHLTLLKKVNIIHLCMKKYESIHNLTFIHILHRLPDKLLDKILCFLSADDTLNLAILNKEFRTLMRRIKDRRSSSTQRKRRTDSFSMSPYHTMRWHFLLPNGHEYILKNPSKVKITSFRF